MTEPSLWQLRKSLSEAATDDPEQPPHARAFAAWMQHGRPDQVSALKMLAELAAVATGPARQTVHTAVLGYAANIDPAFSSAFAESMNWLRERQYFVSGRPLTFEIDGLGLFGAAVGLRSLDQVASISAKP